MLLPSLPRCPERAKRPGKPPHNGPEMSRGRRGGRTQSLLPYLCIGRQLVHRCAFRERPAAPFSLASSLARLQPAFQRGLGFARATSGEKVLHRDILIERWPMNAVASPDELPLSLFRGRAMSQTRIPTDRNRHRPTVNEVDDQGVVCHPYVLGQGLTNINWRRSHPMPFAARPRVFPRVLPASPTLLARIPCCRAAGSALARSWHGNHPGRRVRAVAGSGRLNRRKGDAGQTGGPSALTEAYGRDVLAGKRGCCWLTRAIQLRGT